MGTSFTEEVNDFKNQKMQLAELIDLFKRVTPGDARVIAVEQKVNAIELPSREVCVKSPETVSDLNVEIQFLGNALHAIRMAPEISLEVALSVGRLSAGFDWVEEMFSNGPIDKEEAYRVLGYLCETFIFPAAQNGEFPAGTTDALSVYGHVMTINANKTVTIKTKGGVDLVQLPCVDETTPH